MAKNTLEEILGTRSQESPAKPEAEGDKFFSILVGEGVSEHYLELRFKDGGRLCVSYEELSWFAYDPKLGQIDLDFGGYPVHLKGRGLGDRLFQGIRQKRVAWVKEADSDMEDHPGNDVFIQEISFPSEPEENAAEK